MSDDGVQLDTKVLDQLIRALKEPLPVLRVGIIGKLGRNKGGRTNAEIGAAHEFGTDKLPVRSFLRMPLTENFRKYVDDESPLDEDALKMIVKTGSIVEFMKKLAVIGENVVRDAFQTGGFGKWKPSDMSRKKNHQTLVETTQLRESITSEVK